MPLKPTIIGLNVTSIQSKRKQQLHCSWKADNLLVGKIAGEVNMYEPDSDAVRWGFNFLDVDHIFSSTYYGDNNQGDVNIWREQYIGDDNYNTDCNSVENDETIAHALQEEYSQLTIAEASESSHPKEEHLKVSSTTAPDWLNPSSRNYYSGYKGGQVEPESDDMGPSSSCSSPGNRSYDGEEYSYNLEIADESALDGEVGKRLNQMIPVPHIPRINGDIPSIDEATSDHQRLLDRLQLYDLVEHKVQGDGNCQFRALSDQFYRTPEHHKFVRQQVVNQIIWILISVSMMVGHWQLKSHRDTYEGYVPMEYARSGEWGDHVTLQAAADSYSVKIFNSKRVIFLSFWAEVHYNSIYPQGVFPDIEIGLTYTSLKLNYRLVILRGRKSGGILEISIRSFWLCG
ncbi:unnamed protein product [Camellia sinensis]